MRDEAGFESNERITAESPFKEKKSPPSRCTTGRFRLPEYLVTHYCNDWLDGEVDEMRASEAEGKSKVELWTRINAESEMLRRRVTPVHVQQRIMASLPDTPGTATNW